MYFHHNSIRKYTTSLLKVFNNIEVPRYNEDGTVFKVINIPIVFSTRERAIYLIEKDYTNSGSGDQNILPKMALSLVSIERAPMRDVNKYAKKIFYDENNKPIKIQPSSVSYDMNFTLHIMARTMTDLTIIVEQILPLFRPTMNIRIKELDYFEDTTSVPINFNGISFDFPMDNGEDDDVRILTADIDMTLRGNLFLPIKDSTVITSVYTNIIGNGALAATLEQHAFDDDTIEITNLNTDTTQLE